MVSFLLPQELQALLLQVTNALSGSMDNLRKDLRREFGGLREDLRREFGGLRDEIGGLRDDIGGLRNDIEGLGADIDGLRELDEKKQVALRGLCELAEKNQVALRGLCEHAEQEQVARRADTERLSEQAERDHRVSNANDMLMNMTKETAAAKKRREKKKAEPVAEVVVVEAVVPVVDAVEPKAVEKGEAEAAAEERERQRVLYHERLNKKEKESEMYARGEGRRSPAPVLTSAEKRKQTMGNKKRRYDADDGKSESEDGGEQFECEEDAEAESVAKWDKSFAHEYMMDKGALDKFMDQSTSPTREANLGGEMDLSAEKDLAGIQVEEKTGEVDGIEGKGYAPVAAPAPVAVFFGLESFGIFKPAAKALVRGSGQGTSGSSSKSIKTDSVGGHLETQEPVHLLSRASFQPYIQNLIDDYEEGWTYRNCPRGILMDKCGLMARPNANKPDTTFLWNLTQQTFARDCGLKAPLEWKLSAGNKPYWQPHVAHPILKENCRPGEVYMQIKFPGTDSNYASKIKFEWHNGTRECGPRWFVIQNTLSTTLDPKAPTCDATVDDLLTERSPNKNMRVWMGNKMKKVQKDVIKQVLIIIMHSAISTQDFNPIIELL
ncbi:hypothetical protein B484DRAFT_431927 [Ochromonadaceae sp. CCMP2298]|nr:hypothetical protein B484DRAFT_431927 [Ochromonadaceae sp. CCMP2298]